MDLKKMSKQELIEYITHLLSQRAYSYEDRMKLEIIDQSPFTLWACDRDLKIRLWTCQCENMYGYSVSEAVGNVYLDMFVSDDEKIASKMDCIDIIENGAIFINSIAQDEGRKGKRNIITNCFRIRDVETGEYLQAEIGLDISNLDTEKEKYEIVKRLGRDISLKKTQLIDSHKNMEEHFWDELHNIQEHIVDNERRTLKYHAGLRKKYQSSVNPVKEKIKNLQNWFDELSIQLETKIVEAFSISDCELVDRIISNTNYEIKLKVQKIMLDLDELFVELTNRTEETEREVGKRNMKSKTKRFRIALSFPGEYRDNVIEKISQLLAKEFTRDDILYDKFHSAEFARMDLDNYLQKLYHDESELIVVFLCKDYNDKPWCGIEWRAIRHLTHDRIEATRVMPIKLGDGKVDGIFDTLDGYIEADENNVEEVVKLILDRYQLLN